MAQYSFDGAERLTSINQAKSGTTIFSANYTLDNLGNRTAIADTTGNNSYRLLTYQYDELSRLVQETRPGAASVPVTSTY